MTSNPLSNLCDERGQRPALLLTCYMRGATQGKNLGLPGYSYDFLTQAFLPLLQQWGDVIPVPEPWENLEAAVADARQQGRDVIHVSFLPFQDVFLSETAPNVIVPAWEFPEIPDHPFDDNPQNDWTAVAARCALILAAGPFTADALRRAGVKTPIHVVPTPTAEEYFQVPSWDPAARIRLECISHEFHGNIKHSTGRPSAPRRAKRLGRRVGKALEIGFRVAAQSLIGRRRYQRISLTLQAARRTWRQHPKMNTTRHAALKGLNLTGVVYTSILNPSDGRKNWEDLLTGFLVALGDRPDATLVVKLVTSDPRVVNRIIAYYQHRDMPHRCRVVFISGYLSDEQMLELASASTYYLQTSKAEGIGLPLMNYMAAGRPGISPLHSAIGDYFDDRVGLVVASHPEPGAWPHDSRLRLRATWNRLVWPSLVEQIRSSYQIATSDRRAYDALVRQGQMRMHEWSGHASVWQRLKVALNSLLPNSSDRLLADASRRRSAA